MVVVGFWLVDLGIEVLTGCDDAYRLVYLSSSIVLYWMRYQGFYKYNVLAI